VSSIPNKADILKWEIFTGMFHSNEALIFFV
jgi:hypothetical protein